MFPPPVGNVAPIGSHVPTYTGLTLENNAQTPSPHRGCFLRKNLPLYIPFIPHVIGVVPSASVGVHFPIGGWFHRGMSQLCSPKKGGESAGGMGNTPAFHVPIAYIGKIVIAITHK